MLARWPTAADARRDHPLGMVRATARARTVAAAANARAMVEHPFIYEINTWVWLDELSRRSERRVDLDGVPGARVGRDRGARLRRGLADGRLGAQPGRRSRSRSSNEGLVESFRARAARPRRPRTSSARRTASATTSSPARLGGPDGPRGRAARRSPSAGSALILDFVPNHVAPDHPWTYVASRVLRRAAATTTCARPGVVRARRRPGARQRPRPVLPRVARRRAAERVLARAARGRGRDAGRRSPSSATACAATWRC